ncbi:cytochrome c oxidase subunit 6A2, mitochondrial-like [Athalia rosae]|uniref:cytochrome c oxidase subunit 6A2, mitochondrial-like n=1 Tax=Athalia rosae TaxID=37344 RepID=UPI0006264C33|nr:cytochrome c oxidase subunit 6A2, mitochondrial-like [Athalia rosae]
MAASRMVRIALGRQFSSQIPSNAAVSGHGPEAIKFWKNLSYFVAFPAIILCTVNTYLVHEEEHKQPRPEFIPYDHLRIRTKSFPWGDGQHTLFHSPEYNALPTGYETEDPHHH